MLESESLSIISLTDVSFPEHNVIPLATWQDICLSEIWIPNRLLTNRREPSKTWETKGIFHTLEKKDARRQIESFSVYDESETDDEKKTDDERETDDERKTDDKRKIDDVREIDDLREIDDVRETDDERKTGDERRTDVFDSDDDYSDIIVSKETAKYDSENYTEKSENLSFPGESNLSLNELLNCNKEVDIRNFEFEKNHKHANKELEQFQSNKKNKNTKKKKVKSVTLDKFLENYTEEDKQETCANEYLQKLLMSKYVCPDNQIQLKNNLQFPKLTSNKIEFIHYEQAQKKSDTEFIHNLKQPDVTIKNIAADMLPKSEKNDVSLAEAVEPASESVVGRIIIENIPLEVSHEDIFLLLCGYGEVKNFSMEPDGEFLKASVEIDLVCDIDWITECLNGTEPFGASTRLLKCYKQSMD